MLPCILRQVSQLCPGWPSDRSWPCCPLDLLSQAAGTTACAINPKQKEMLVGECGGLWLEYQIHALVRKITLMSNFRMILVSSLNYNFNLWVIRHYKEGYFRHTSGDKQRELGLRAWNRILRPRLLQSLKRNHWQPHYDSGWKEREERAKLGCSGRQTWMNLVINGQGN